MTGCDDQFVWSKGVAGRAWGQADAGLVKHLIAQRDGLSGTNHRCARLEAGAWQEVEFWTACPFALGSTPWKWNDAAVCAAGGEQVGDVEVIEAGGVDDGSVAVPDGFVFDGFGANADWIDPVVSGIDSDEHAVPAVIAFGCAQDF